MSGSNQLLRVLGLVFGLAAVVGSVIGQGILRSPGVVAEATGSGTVIIGLWVAGAFIACLNAFAWAELGAAIPRAGGPFAFIHRAFGGHASLLTAFAMLISAYATIAYFCFVIGEFLVRLGIGQGEYSPLALGFGVLGIITLANATGTRLSGFTQIVLSTLKGMVLLGLVIALFASPAAAPAPASEPVRSDWLALGTAVVVIITTYAGWQNVTFYGEELENPGKSLPRALFGGIIGVGAIYIVVNLAMLHVMTPDQMAGSNLVAADAAGIAFGPRADFLLTCFGVLSVSAIASLGLMSFTRITFAVARAGILPKWLAVVDNRGTPMRAMLSAVLASALLMLTGSYTALVTMAETVFLPIFIAVPLAVLVLRRREPDLVRPYRVPFYPFTIYASIAVEIVLMVIFVVQDPFYAFASFALVGVMWLVFQFVARMRGATGIVGAEVENL